jgi:hypothetical protein
MRNILVTTLVVVGTLALVRAVTAQVQPVPGPGSGVVTVTGKVEVTDGTIRAVQVGDWRVVVANAPDVRVVNTPAVAAAAWPFLKQGSEIAVGWPDGTIDTIRIARLGGGGWVQGSSAGRTRWFNLDVAKYVQETK